MKYEAAIYLTALFGVATAAPMPVAAPKNVFSIPRAMLRGREVPQEHSHDRFLDGVRVNLALNNPNNIQDPVFGLLGSAAAAAGAGTITNLDCLHQATADQAFTNAKAAGNVTGQADALMYAALERNTGKVGLASVICNETAVNPEIAAVQQHQDPASTGAAAGNKAVVLALAKQLASIGADPQEALLSGTFAPGDPTDTTGKGNSCDTVNDPDGGCIFSQNLLVDDATAAEISAAVAGIAVATGSGSNSAASVVATSAVSVATSPSPASATDSSASDCSVAFSTTTVDSSAATSTAAAASTASESSSASSVSTASGSLDFGSCADPTILFENGLDGRTQEAFIAANQESYNHGSALNIGVIASFICGQLSTSCKAPDTTNTACTAAEAAASAAGGTTQAAADAWNSALGVSASTSTSTSTASTSASSGASAVSSPVATATSVATSSTSSTAMTSANVQTFTGSLGGLPPAVVEGTGDRPFSVNGDTFVNEAAALQRSCSVQNNACSNAVNSGTLTGTTVADCGTQEDACNAAAST